MYDESRPAQEPLVGCIGGKALQPKALSSYSGLKRGKEEKNEMETKCASSVKVDQADGMQKAHFYMYQSVY
ncbi:hypothetical protein EYF80_020652 [Liparis tanakae]|uniref:Uncharacterized protein n=1 Tax=Liparis tanakae TaxID=230148 RepID=A0A4Z2HTD2_9TELE|nr:hypothetical protein EYF80_020652 [Liparis tanakae]